MNPIKKVGKVVAGVVLLPVKIIGAIFLLNKFRDK